MVPAGLSGYGTDWDRLALGGVTVSDLLAIDLVLLAVMIMVAAVIIVRRGRSPRSSTRPEEVAELAGEGAALAQVPVVPGFSDAAAGPDPSLNGLHRAAYEPGPGALEPDPGALEPDPGAREPDPVAREPDPGAREPDPGARVPAALEREASSQVSAVADAEPGVREPAGPEQEASSQLSHVADAGPGPRAPAAEVNGRPGPDGTVTSNGRVYRYYDGADQPIADYLAELGWDEEPGWAEEPGARDPR
jgi:hypothetical protein